MHSSTPLLTSLRRVCVALAMLWCGVAAALAESPADSIAAMVDSCGSVEMLPVHLSRSEVELTDADSLMLSGMDSLAVPQEAVKVRVFNPDPTRAVWLSALCPGLGQLYNRRYWKLPIVVGAYMGLAYATSWNNGMLTDYTRAYRDLMDSDPNTNSYMNFFAPNVKEEDLNRTWVENVFRSRRNFFRRNRDLCIISMVGVYLLAMVDAYVDASLAHFDISPDLQVDWAPAVIPESRGGVPGVGVQWALTF